MLHAICGHTNPGTNDGISSNITFYDTNWCRLGFDVDFPKSGITFLSSRTIINNKVKENNFIYTENQLIYINL